MSATAFPTLPSFVSAGEALTDMLHEQIEAMQEEPLVG